jgi:hypothetical protein
MIFAGLLEGYDPGQHWFHGVNRQPQHPANRRGLQRFREAGKTDQAPGSNQRRKCQGPDLRRDQKGCRRHHEIFEARWLARFGDSRRQRTVSLVRYVGLDQADLP